MSHWLYESVRFADHLHVRYVVIVQLDINLIIFRSWVPLRGLCHMFLFQEHSDIILIISYILKCKKLAVIGRI